MVPVGLPVHRNLSGHAGAGQRLAWVQRLFADAPKVRVWDWEVRRSQPTSTLDTLEHLRQVEPDARILLLLGADAFAGMQSWIGYPQHRRYCDIAVFSRQGCERPQLPEWPVISVPQWQQTEGSGRVVHVDVLLPEVSATELRSRLEQGLPVDAYIPAPIEQEVRAAYRGAADR